LRRVRGPPRVLGLTPCVPVVSVSKFQLAESVPRRLCFPPLPPMIAQHAHSVSSVRPRSMCLHRVGGFEGGYLGQGLSRVEAPWMVGGDEPVVQDYCAVIVMVR
jgi:hypothetical protein